MADVKIASLPNAAAYTNNDLFIIDQTAGTAKTTYQDLKAGILNGAINTIIDGSAAAHNSIYRGKSLGGSITATQWASIKNGDFSNLYIGDFWTINNTVYRIAAFDYYYGKRTTTHHVVIVPDTAMSDYCAMSSTSGNADGYIGTDVYTTTLATARNQIVNTDFKNHVLAHEIPLSSSVQDGIVNGLSAVSVDVVLMTAGNVLGQPVQTIETTDNPARLSDYDMEQFPLFAYYKHKQMAGANYWLRDVTGSGFAAFFNVGQVRRMATTSSGYAKLRPCFCIYSE